MEADMSKAVKLSDIAQMMGVSSVTVSKALSGKKGVSEEMRKKIRDKADELGYKQPSEMRRLYEPRQYTIGVLIAARYVDRQASFYWKMYQELTAKALLKECITSLEIITQDDENNGVMPTLVAEQRVDGFIVLGPVAGSFIDAVTAHTDIPMVYLDGADNKREMDSVITDNYYGMYRMTRYLLERGHRKIAFVGTIGSTESITDRYFGYAKAMKEYGMDVLPGKDVIDDRFVEDGLTENYEIELPDAKHMPTAFACNCDRTAAKVIGNLEKQGYNVPRDISVVGFDNYLYPGLCDVKITTYEVDMRELTSRSLYILLKKVEREYYKKGVSIVEGHLVEHGSVSNVRKGN